MVGQDLLTRSCLWLLPKTWLVTKKDYLPAATAIFTGTKVNVTSEGRPLLGAAIGTREFIHQHVMKKVHEWSQEIENLSTIAQTQPHAAYAAYTHGMVSKWSYLSRIVPDIGHLLEPLEHLIRTKLIPVLTGRPPPNDGFVCLASETRWTGSG